MLYGESQLSRVYLITNCYEYLSWITFLKVLTVCVAQYDQSWFLCKKPKSTNQWRDIQKIVFEFYEAFILWCIFKMQRQEKIVEGDDTSEFLE
ncbi:unnamed protein product [Larinioides sclopetarius]|uniref:Uncharacterized protein n=1 Tax=Larinioides sclopetarius TaxID=280406 RepID=A0AAV2BN45_9ARAC